MYGGVSATQWYKCVYTHVHSNNLCVCVCVCICIKCRETKATTSRHMAHMSSRSAGTLCNLEPVGEHVAASPTAAIKMIPRMTFVDRFPCVFCLTLYVNSSTGHIYTSAGIHIQVYIRCMLCRDGPSHNQMQDPLTCVRKWDCDRMTALISGLWGQQWYCC